MTASSIRQTAVAVAVAGTLAAGAAPSAQANVLNVSWSGAFTMLNPTGGDFGNVSSDYVAGYYGNGDSAATSGTPYFPGNVSPGADCTSYSPACVTTHGWYGYRTPVSGTMSFDTSTGAGVGTVNDFFFFGDTPGAGSGTSVARAVGISFATIDTVGTIVGTMLFSWNGSEHSVSMVLDGSGLFANLDAMVAGGPTSTIFGVGALPATDGINLGTATIPVYYPLGPSPIASKTLNTGGGTACDGVPIAEQMNAYTIIGIDTTITACTTGMVDDGIGGDPMTSGAFPNYNINLDVKTLHYEPLLCLDCQFVPVPSSLWLFGTGLLGIIGLVRRKRTN